MVKAGELIAEVDLEYLKQKNISATTPVLICAGPENILMKTARRISALRSLRQDLVTLPIIFPISSINLWV